MPSAPYANLLGRITSVEQLSNPVTGTPLWRIGVEAGVALEVIVRKDRCDGVPGPGHFFAGSVWLLGDIVPGREPPAGYIR